MNYSIENSEHIIYSEETEKRRKKCDLLAREIILQSIKKVAIQNNYNCNRIIEIDQC